MATAIMKQKEVPEMDDVEEIISKISEDSPYKRRPTQKRTWMTVPEMGKLLGLKKTDRYWLVHKNVFESKEIAGKIRINIASFEKWYANQIKYHKVTGEEPGKELKSWSYSVKEVADLLGVDEYLVYDLLKKNQMEAVIVDYWKRIPKESFQNWYKSQSRYRTREDREKDALLEDATITMPEMAQLLGTTRSSVYTILDNPKYSHFFEFIVIAEKKRITKESFQKFLEGQDRYKLDPSNDYEELAQEQNIALANYRLKKLSQTGIRGSNGNIKYLTFDEASYLAKVSRSMINKWADTGKFTSLTTGDLYVSNMTLGGLSINSDLDGPALLNVNRSVDMTGGTIDAMFVTVGFAGSITPRLVVYDRIEDSNNPAYFWDLNASVANMFDITLQNLTDLAQLAVAYENASNTESGKIFGAVAANNNATVSDYMNAISEIQARVRAKYRLLNLE